MGAPFALPDQAEIVHGLVGAGVGGMSLNVSSVGYDAGAGGGTTLARPRVLTGDGTEPILAAARGAALAEGGTRLLLGGSAAKLLALAQSRAELAFLAPQKTSLWDTCAPEAVLRAAGGSVSDLLGEDLEYPADPTRKNERGVIGAAPGEEQRHRALVDRLSADQSTAELAQLAAGEELEGCHRRRLREWAPARDANAWHAQWRERIECWFLGLPMPTRTQLAHCMGALSLHLGSRLESVLRSANVGGGVGGGVGRGVGGGVGGGSKPPGAESALAAVPEPGCEWVRNEVQLQLPQFPSFGSFEFELPPIPRLLPSYERLQGLIERSGASPIASAPRPTTVPPRDIESRATAATAAVSAATVAVGAASGFGAALATALVVYSLASLRVAARKNVYSA